MMQMPEIQIAPSILSADFAALGADCERMQRAGAEMLHLDVMDGHFVPNISFGPPVIQSLRPRNRMFFDVHLMIEHPLRYLEAFAKAGAEGITFHLECADDAGETLAAIEALGLKRAVALKPATPAEAVYPYLDRVDMVLVMTVEPGFGGQSFMADMLPKIAAIRAEAPGLAIQVDGGISEKTAPQVASAGANVLVAGSALFSQADSTAAVAGLRAAAQAGQRAQ